jgi:hypothetical protein
MTPQEAVESLITSALAAGQRTVELSAKPDGPLLHFTDAAGLAGIIGSQKLWATRASCMNDASEISYGRDLGRALVEDRVRTDPKSRFLPSWKTALAHFDALSEHVYIDAFVTSFCTHARKSVHWQEYGRRGHGYALGIDPSAFEVPGWSLAPVIYDRSIQRRILADVFDKIQETAATLADNFRLSPAVVKKIESTAGALLVDLTALLAPCLKDRAFDAEDEWRLWRFWLESNKAKQVFPLKFRAHGDLVVPYTEFAVKPDAVKAIIMGYQVPEHPVRQSLRLLLRESGIDPAAVDITRSDVPVLGAA